MAQEATIVDGKPINEPSVKTRVRHSTFPLGAPVVGTYRYGEYGVIFADENIAGDGFTWRLPHEIRSFMLKGPLMQGMKVCKDMFWIPKMSIIPRAWERLNTIAQFGDTAPEDADTVIYNFQNAIAELTTDYIFDINDGVGQATLINSDGSDKGLVNHLFHLILWMEMFYSRGSLMAACGYPMGAYFKNTHQQTKSLINNFGYWFDSIIGLIKECCDELYIEWNNGTRINVVKFTEEECISKNHISLRTALCKMRDDFDFVIEPNAGKDKKNWATKFQEQSWEPTITQDQSEEDKPFNYERMVAYQMACAQYYTNDHIDYIYTAELYRELMGSYIHNIDTSTFAQTWNYNGINIQYDYLSGYMLEAIINNSPLIQLNKNQWAYIRGIFQFNRSLRFKDYFTGSRSVPLAVGEYNIPVDLNNQLVNVIDVTKGILWQKLGNAMQKTGARIEKQIKQLQGEDMKPDYHNPFWLGHTEDGIGASESEGTAEALFYDDARNGNKLPVAAQFRSNSGRMQFSTKLDREGIILAIQYFEIPRLYVNTTERFFYHANMFDKFNTYLQFMGDQEVKQCELDVTRKFEDNFGYQGRNMEYKQKVGRAWGGLVYDLPGWCFIADFTRDGTSTEHISPSYIRSLQTEIDELFQTLYGYSIDTYYHFICKTSLSNVARRPMAAKPGILTR